MTAIRCAGALVALLLLTAVPLHSEEAAAGRVKVTEGQAFVVRDRTAIPAKVGQMVYEADSLRTGADGKLGVTMKDDTRVSIGPASEVRLNRFAYAPSEGRLAFAMKVMRGAAAYVSGRIAKLSPDAVRLETPAAIVGVRGTTMVISASE